MGFRFNRTIDDEVVSKNPAAKTHVQMFDYDPSRGQNSVQRDATWFVAQVEAVEL